MHPIASRHGVCRLGNPYFDMDLTILLKSYVLCNGLCVSGTHGIPLNMIDDISLQSTCAWASMQPTINIRLGMDRSQGQSDIAYFALLEPVGNPSCFYTPQTFSRNNLPKIILATKDKFKEGVPGSGSSSLWLPLAGPCPNACYLQLDVFGSDSMNSSSRYRPRILQSNGVILGKPPPSPSLGNQSGHSGQDGIF